MELKNRNPFRGPGLNILLSPDHVFKEKGWIGWGDWLGTGTIANFNKEYRSFEEARKFARSLKLKSSKEWYEYCKENLRGLLAKPNDIPTAVDRSYRGEGWISWYDWLGTESKKKSK